MVLPTHKLKIMKVLAVLGFCILVNRGSTVVEHLPHHLKVGGTVQQLPLSLGEIISLFNDNIFRIIVELAKYRIFVLGN